MIRFLSFNCAGICVQRDTLQAAKHVPACNLIIETDNQFSPRPINSALMLAAHADSEPYWIPISTETAEHAIAVLVIARNTNPDNHFVTSPVS